MVKPSNELKPGQIVGGKYRVDRVLGKGGMGIVVAATDTTLGRPVALKALLPALAADDDWVARFLREARSVVQLTSEHVVRVYEVGELASGTPYMVMELLVGQDLESVVAERTRLPFGEAVDLLLQAIVGIAEAHAAGIVHRDLKPANLFMTRRNDGSTLVKILDFGLAKAPPRPEERGLTSTSAIMGSPAYMSPEQLRGMAGVERSTDIWALGVCLHELTTGAMPFDAPTIAEASMKILKEEPVAACVACPDVPFGLSQVIKRCLAKEVTDRYPDVAELAAALEPYASAEAIGLGDVIRRILTGRRPPREAPPSEPDAIATAPTMMAPKPLTETSTAAAVDSGPLPRPRWVLRSVLAGAAAMALLGLVLYGVERTPSRANGGSSDARASATPSAEPIPSDAPTPTATELAQAAPVAVDAGVPEATTTAPSSPPPRASASVRRSSPPKTPPAHPAAHGETKGAPPSPRPVPPEQRY